MTVIQDPSSSHPLHSCTMATPGIEDLQLSDSDTEDLFASPSRPSKPSQKSSKQSDAATRKEESKYDAEQAREASLQRELKSVRSINDVIEGVVKSLECARGNMDVSGYSSHPGTSSAHGIIRLFHEQYHQPQHC